MGAETLVLVPGLMCDHAVRDALQPDLGTDIAVVVADHNDADSLEAMAQRVLSRARGGARLEVVEHAGHMAAMEQPELVAAALRRWLAAS